MRKGVKIVRNPESIKIAVDKTRSKILDLLKEKDMAISELSKILDKDRSTIHRHIQRLLEVGLVEMVSEKKGYHVPGKIYGRTADIFLMTTDKVDDKVDASSIIEWDVGDAKKILERMDRMGYKNSSSDELALHISEFFSSFSERSKYHFKKTPQNMGLLDFFRLKLLMLLLETENHHELEEFSKKVASDFKSDG